MSSAKRSLKEVSIDTEYGTVSYYKYLSNGKSPVALFIHGLGGSKNWFPNSLHEYSLDRFSWVVPDLIGHGSSSRSPIREAYTMEHQAEVLLPILKKENANDIIVLAHSMGGPIAISLLELLASNNHMNIGALFYLEGNLDVGDAFVSSRVIQKSYDDFERGFQGWVNRLYERAMNPSIVEWVQGLAEAGPFTVWHSSYYLVKASKSGTLLERLKSLMHFPVHFIFGEKNKGQYSSEDLLREEGFAVEFIPKAGHAMFAENPSDFWSLVLELIEK